MLQVPTTLPPQGVAARHGTIPAVRLPPLPAPPPLQESVARMATEGQRCRATATRLIGKDGRAAHATSARGQQWPGR